MTSGRYDRIACSVPRGNGKSWTAAALIVEALRPDGALFQSGYESCLFAPSLESCRIVYKFVRRSLPESDYSWQDSGNRIGIRHKATDTRLRAIGSKGTTAMGIGADTVLAILDEPGSLEARGGQLLEDTISTSLGKPGSVMRACYIGTLWPMRADWWGEMVNRGTHGRTYVQSLHGDPETWDRWPTIRKANPLTAVSPEFRRKLIEERDEARRDERLRARFLATRLNVPARDPSTVLLTIDDWKRVESRPVPPRAGRPICGVDLGGGRAWSAAVALYRNGRVEAFAVAPGIPDLAEQERRDRVSRGTYTRLLDSGALVVDAGRRVQRVAPIVAKVREWGAEVVIADRFRELTMADEMPKGVPFVTRATRWKESTEDIRALRAFAADGPLACDPGSRPLVAASLAVSDVRPDDAGCIRLVKRSTNNTSRDDVSQALVLAAGLMARIPPRPTGPRHRVC